MSDYDEAVRDLKAGLRYDYEHAALATLQAEVEEWRSVAAEQTRMERDRAQAAEREVERLREALRAALRHLSSSRATEELYGMCDHDDDAECAIETFNILHRALAQPTEGQEPRCDAHGIASWRCATWYHAQPTEGQERDFIDELEAERPAISPAPEDPALD